MRELIKNCMERINKMKRLRLIAINLMNVAANFLPVSFGQRLVGLVLMLGAWWPALWVPFEWMGVRLWRRTYVPARLASGSYQGFCGKHVLVASFSRADPYGTFGSSSPQ
jgi:hypothetical protein